MKSGMIDEIVGLKIAHEVSQGLAAAYRHELLHRDIKPGNILLDQEGTAKLVDFGLALVQGADEDPLAEMWATPFYVPPEKLVGHPEDFRSDIYSLGATLFHIFAGKPPFDVETESVSDLIAIKEQPIDLKAHAPHLSDATIALVNRMMMRNPNQRHRSYEELVDHVSSVRATVDPNYSVGGKGEGIPLWLKLSGTMLALAILGGVGAYLVKTNKGDEQVQIGGVNGGGEVIINATDMTLAKEFDEAKRLLAGGEQSQARDLFSKVAKDDAARDDLQAWSYFHLGLIALLNEDLGLAKEQFRSANSLTGKLARKDKDFLSSVAPELASDKKASATLLEEHAGKALAHLEFMALGLKGWAMGDYKAARDFLRAYRETQPGSDDDWALAYQAQVKSFVEDADILTSAPRGFSGRFHGRSPNRGH